jgi:UDP-N-acetylmuramate--alanine ligase
VEESFVMKSPRPFQGRRYHFSGVGGSGMAPLALLSAALGADVTGSDRNRDRGVALPVFDHLQRGGVRLVAQDGSGIDPRLDAVVYSTAVEPSNPDMQRAGEAGRPLIRRGSFLASIASTHRTIAVAGTSGKSTVTAMTAHILCACGADPSFLGGGPAVDLAGSIPPGSLRVGAGDWFVVETDESDGSVSEFAPEVALLTNLSRDHKEIDETARNFASLLRQTSAAAVVNVADPPLAAVMIPPSLRLLRAAVEGVDCWAVPDLLARDVTLQPTEVAFRLDGVLVHVPFPGRLTVENALLSIAGAVAAGFPLDAAAGALATFRGVKRRLERVGAAAGIDVFDDFAHNPVKIGAALDALRSDGALWVCYQPHGYGPTRFFADGLVETFQRTLRAQDRLLLAPIYDAGGTANRTIRSEDLVERLRSAGVGAEVSPTREAAMRTIAGGVRAGDRVVSMGARDDTLPRFARAILEAIATRAAEPASRDQSR